MRKVKLRKGSWIVFLLSTFAWFAPPAQAEFQSGLNVTVYDNYWYNNAPPLPTVSGRPIVGTTTEPQINNDFDSYPLFNMYEDFIVKYEGYITSPITADISFYPSADDGTKLYIDDALVDNNWYDKGCCGTPTEPIHFVAGVPQKITLWFYENGGGAWVELYWDINGDYSLVPEESFTRTDDPNPLVVPTTTTTSTTTSTTTTTTTSTTTTTTTTEVPTTTTVYAPTTEPTTTTTEAETTTTTSSTTTTTPPTTEKIEDRTTLVSTTTTEAPTTTSIAETTTSTTTFVTPKTTALAPTTTTTTSTTTIPMTTTSTALISTTTTVEPSKALENAIEQAKTAEDFKNVINNADLTTIKPEELTNLINNELITQLDSSEIEQVFAEINFDTFTQEQLDQVVSTLSKADSKVKKAFENQINIYSNGSFDKYVPSGSTIDVATRRVIIAISAAISTVSIATSSASASGGEGRRRK